jgi:hypothetical protein
MHPELITNSVNPRSVVSFFNSISSIPDFSHKLSLVTLLGESSVGPEFTALFVAFINNRLDKLVHPKEILEMKDDERVGAKLMDCIGVSDKYRPDIASILNTRIINYSLKFAESNKIDDKLISRFTYLATEDILGDDLKYVLVKKLVNGNKSKFQKLIANSKIADMCLK